MNKLQKWINKKREDGYDVLVIGWYSAEIGDYIWVHMYYNGLTQGLISHLGEGDYFV